MVEPEITVGIGNPSSPYHGQLLSEEDEKRLDDKGRPVVEGLTWGEAKTGLYLALAVSKQVPMADRRMLGGHTTDIPDSGYKITCGSFRGRPAFHCPVIGASLELPSDLGRDALKRKYVIEWLVETAKEAMDHLDIKMSPQRRSELGLWLAMASQAAVERTGL